MKTKVFLTIALVSAASMASAEEYVCKVYCKSGTTSVEVKAGSKEEAAAKVDRMPDQVCKGEGKGNKSDETMRPDQCSRK